MDQTPPRIDLCLVPAGIPPKGIIFNLENPKQTLVPVQIAMCATMTTLIALFTVCRLVANWRKMWWSDYTVIIVLICAVGNTAISLATLKFARHQWDLLFSSSIMPNFALFFSKLSVFLMFYQIFKIESHMLVAIRFGIAFSAVLYFISIPLAATLGAPHVGQPWSSVLTDGRPQKELIWGVIQSSVGVLLDLFIFILPIPIILKLNLSGKKKIQVLAVFTTAMIGVVSNVLFAIYRIEAIGTNDGTWKYTSLGICSLVECDVAIIVSCAPGFANFTKIYISELQIVKLLRYSFGRNGSGISDFAKGDPNRPRTGKAFKKHETNEFIEIDDISKNASSLKNGESVSEVSRIVRTIEVSQDTHHLSSKSAVEIQEPEVQEV